MPRLTFVAALLHAALSFAAEPSFTPLPGATTTRIAALSADGFIAVGESAGFPVRWTRDGSISPLADFPAAVTDVSARGDVAVGYQNPPDQRFPRAFRWIAGEGVTRLQDADMSRGRSFPLGVSPDGSVVVGDSHGAVRWIDGFPMELGVGSLSWAREASQDGSVIVGTSSQLQGAFRWENGQVSFIGPMDALDMTPDGRVVVGTDGVVGFRWTQAAGLSPIGIIPGGISDGGQLVIGRLGSNLPALWTEAGGALELQPFLTGLGLDLTGWQLTSVTAISGDGTTIAGQGIPPEPSMSGAWIATIPEPSTWLLGGVAISVSALGVLLGRRVAT